MKKYAIILLLLIPELAFASSYYIDTRLAAQVRGNALAEKEYPFTTYLDTGLKELPKDGTFDVSLKNSRTMRTGSDSNDFDLYQAVFRTQNLGGMLDISAGRQFISPGFHAYLMDGLNAAVGKDDWPILVKFFGGVPRYTETGDFHGTTGLVTGTAIEMQMFERMNTRLSAVYDKLDIHNNDWKDNDTVLVGMSHSQIFSAKLEPTLYGTMEYDTAGKIVNAGILGFSIKPHRRVYWNIEGGHHEINRDWNRTSIFSLFATGPLHQGRSEVSITLLEEKGAFKDVVLTGGYAYQRLKISSSVSENGHLANGGLGFHIIPLRLDTNLAYALYDSFGGRAHDVSVTLHDEPIDPLVVDAGANFTKYFKVTNDNDTAISAFLEAGIKIIKRLTFSANGEYLRNNTFDKEFRVMARLGYSLEGSI